MNPYGAVNHDTLLPVGYRCTAYWYASHRGLPVVIGYLLRLGQEAARIARRYATVQAKVWETHPENPAGAWVHQWELWVWDQAAAQVSLPPAPPPPVPLLTAWQYAFRGHLLTGDYPSDSEFVGALDRYAWYVGHKRGMQAVLAAQGDDPAPSWPEPVWRDVADTMAERGAESGDWHLYDIDLDAIAGGYLPHRRYASRPPTQNGPWQQWNGQPPGLGHGFFAYPGPSPDTQAGYDYDQFMNTDEDPYDGNPYA